MPGSTPSPSDEAVVLRVADVLDEGGGFEQRLGRDAAAMEARPADLVLVDEGDLQAELGRPERGGVAARARAEDDEIEVVGRADGHGVRRPSEPRTRARSTAGWAGGSSVRMVRGGFGSPQPTGVHPAGGLGASAARRPVGR